MVGKINSRSLLLCLLCLGCSFMVRAKTVRMVVKEELVACTGVAPMNCMQVKFKDSRQWELFYSQISGFSYESGYRYVLLVDVVKRKQVPADASAYSYKLKKILEKKKISPAGDSRAYVLKHQWKLIQMNGAVQENSPVYLVYDSTGKRVSGHAGCNRFFGACEITKDSISFKQMGSTLMACREELNQLEQRFLQLLGEHTFRYDVADQTLNLYQDNRLVLMFGRAPLDK